MIKKRVWRFYCEHVPCRRAYMKRSSCNEHERRCFYNPGREPYPMELYPFPGSDGEHDIDNPVWPRLVSEDEFGDLAGWEPEDDFDLDTWVYLVGDGWLRISHEDWKRAGAWSAWERREGSAILLDTNPRAEDGESVPF